MTSSAAAPFLPHFPESVPVGEPARRRRVRWALIFSAWTVYGLSQGVLMKVTLASYTWRWAIEICTGVALFWALLTPAIVWIQRRIEEAKLGTFGAIIAHGIIAPAVALLVTMVRQRLTTALSPVDIGPLLPSYVYWLDVHILTYAMVVAAAWALGLHRQYRDRTVRTHMLEVQLARAQLQFLGLQLQPHFLFNCLNAISELAHEAPVAAERMLRQLHTLLRLSLERAGQDEVTLDEELASLDPYFDIQRARFSEWLTVHLEVEPGARLALVPHLILQPLVENAIRHGLAVRSAPGSVGVRAWVSDSRLHLEVLDNGVGLSPTRTSFRPGIGLKNAKSRLTQLYGDDHRFELRSGQDGGTVVALEIPYRSRALLADQPPPDWSATGEWSMMPPQRLWSTPAAGTPAAGQSTAAAVAQSRWNGFEASEIFGTGPPSLARTASVTEGAERGSDVATDSTLGATPALKPGRESPRLSGRGWLAIAGVWAGSAVLWSLQVYYFAVTRGTPEEGEQIQYFLTHLVSAAAWALFTPLVLFLARRFRIGRRDWPSRILLHAVLAVVVATAHVAIVRATGLMGDFGLFSSLSFNQISGNVFIYSALLAWSHGRDFYAWYRERDVSAVRLEAAIARSRYQTLCVQLRPQFLLGTIELLARLVHEDVNRTERLIARLADVLRLTLDAAGERETSLRRELELVRAYVDVHDLGVRPGTALTLHVAPETLSVRLPNRLLRTLIDDLLTGNSGGPLPPESMAVTVESERLVGGTTRVRVHAVSPEGEAAETGRPGGWVEAVEKATLAERDRKVSLYFPDSMTAIVLLADRDAEASRDSAPALLSAQPA
jgi:two-component system, LytTR family, sensor kinase